MKVILILFFIFIGTNLHAEIVYLKCEIKNLNSNDSSSFTKSIKINGSKFTVIGDAFLVNKDINITEEQYSIRNQLKGVYSISKEPFISVTTIDINRYTGSYQEIHHDYKNGSQSPTDTLELNGNCRKVTEKLF